MITYQATAQRVAWALHDGEAHTSTRSEVTAAYTRVIDPANYLGVARLGPENLDETDIKTLLDAMVWAGQTEIEEAKILAAAVDDGNWAPCADAWCNDPRTVENRWCTDHQDRAGVMP